jgi:hypothetical protein
VRSSLATREHHHPKPPPRTVVTDSNTAIGYLQHFRLDRELAEGGMG